MQMVEIAKALSENAKILILDEPTSALSEAETDKLMEILETLRSLGVTCIYITHKLEEFFRITDTVTVLRDGKTVTTQPTKDLTREKLVSYMVGREMKERFPRGNRRPGEVMFEVTDLQAVDPNETSRKVLEGVTFDLRRGEILGIAGLMGSGRTELVTTIFGEYGKITGGSIKLEGQELHIHNARDAMHKGISLVPEDLALTHRLAVLLAKVQNENPGYRLPELANELAGVAQNRRRILGFGEDAQGYTPKPGVITVATMHAAKGLEWDRVYLTAVNTYSFPSGAEGDEYRSERWYVRDRLNLLAETQEQLTKLADGSLDEYREGDATVEARLELAAERLRLFYVGVTRARRELIVTYNTGRQHEQKPLQPAVLFTAMQEYLNMQATD